MYNKATLVGRLVRDLELKYTTSGKAVGNFTIAVDRGYGDKKETDFIKCIAWEKTAESMANFTKKGSLVLVDGSIKTGSYDKEGVKVYTTDIQVARVVFLDSKSKAEVPDDVDDIFEIKDNDIPF